MTDSKTKTGKINHLDRGNRFGFIAVPDMKGKLFFHRNDLAAGADMPKMGDTVTFEVGRNDRGPCAVNIRPSTSTRSAPGNAPRGPHPQGPSGPRHGRPRGGKNPARASSTAAPSVKAPYTFVPVITGDDPDARLFDAVFHDGKGHAPDHFNTGALRLTLTALTPLLVGQRSYKASAIEGGGKSDIIFPKGDDEDRGPPKKKAAVRLPASWGPVGFEKDGHHYVEPEKTVLEPMLIGTGPSLTEQRVVIPGTSLKGMLRASIGALLAAPMERVAEQYYSYRPNLDFRGGPWRYQYREAIVIDPASFPASFDTPDDDAPPALSIFVLPVANDQRHAWFINDNACGIVSGAAKSGSLSKGQTINGIEQVTYFNRKKNREERKKQLQTGRGTFTPSEDMRVVPYRGGIDGDGLLARDTPGARLVFRHNALLPEHALEGASDRPGELDRPDDTRDGYHATIAPHIVRQYLKTARELADEKRGHLARHPSRHVNADTWGQIRSTLAANRSLVRHQLIYVEIDTAGNVVSFGRHFRYRWRYADSVRSVQKGATGKREPRPSVHPLKGEHVGPDGGRLSGARNMFGYVAGEDNPDTAPLGEKTHARLAGRIAINHALEVATESSEPSTRFVRRTGATDSDAAGAFNVALGILGSPKASAVEHYIHQSTRNDAGETATYGDLPGVLASGVELNGRKFYRHQPVDASGPLSFEAPASLRHSALATMARFISRPGTRFRFTVRFKDLRDWELGAILVALQPDLLLGRLDQLDAQTGKLVAATAANRHGDGPAFANKLGHARPMGLGSVGLEIDEMALIQRQPDPQVHKPDSTVVGKAIDAFVDLVKERELPLAAWLRAVRYAGCETAEYPQINGRVFDYHTKVRRAHSVKRRASEPAPGPDRSRSVF